MQLVHQNGLARERLSMHDLPDELLIHVLSFLDIPDLYSTSLVGNNFREYIRSVHESADAS